MAITAEALAERIAELQRQRAQHLANAHACDGAIQECENWRAALQVEGITPPAPFRLVGGEESGA